MTIKEFIEKVNQVAYARLTSAGFIHICVDNKVAGFWFLRINPSEQGLEAEVDWKYANGLGETDLFYILGLMQELRKTPVKERFPEKKYRLYVMRKATGPIPDKCYLGNYGRSATDEHFDYVRQKDAWILSENQIKNIRSYTPLIDAFKKEEVSKDE